ncbi:hypothetical protein [Helicobacter sp.]|uniref:hypothetical protein n=1 Tax=Helicobacter sp. TaxID=218 RepID=UPI00198D85E4|nr:hypothetical protein [Helicobacter sp.]MBD5165403.1 hypothetical protein [Helicobacter sp.]
MLHYVRNDAVVGLWSLRECVAFVAIYNPCTHWIFHCHCKTFVKGCGNLNERISPFRFHCQNKNMHNYRLFRQLRSLAMTQWKISLRDSI